MAARGGDPCMVVVGNSSHREVLPVNGNPPDPSSFPKMFGNDGVRRPKPSHGSCGAAGFEEVAITTVNFVTRSDSHIRSSKGHIGSHLKIGSGGSSMGGSGGSTMVGSGGSTLDDRGFTAVNDAASNDFNVRDDDHDDIRVKDHRARDDRVVVCDHDVQVVSGDQVAVGDRVIVVDVHVAGGDRVVVVDVHVAGGDRVAVDEHDGAAL
ncbi:hypothetical protein AMTR_s00009p00246670 [Amborella trichopoda]|uniref:Uncharacterized protein n=1 Tax=Amborella trichopoda TaxID=13333 RepID=W1NHU4_AMBTC|nr:hypothetical protein AMTR_s00009p00246670 [Amborella trichopoda]